jgi:hypothetical protein
MGKAFKCELTGKLFEGDGNLFVDIPVDESVTLRVNVFVKESPGVIRQSVMSGEAALEIANALKPLIKKA